MFGKPPILTKTERDILIMTAEHPNSNHLTNNEISRYAGITVNNVKAIIHQACLKLGADNRNEAVLLANKRGEIHLNELISLDELAEIIKSVDPAELKRIAGCVRHNQVDLLFENGNQIKCMPGRQNGILTHREKDVLILASYGLTNKEMADRLYMSAHAIKNFLNRAFSKLGARMKADAILLALKRGEISVGEISSLEEFTNFIAPLGVEAIEKLAQILETRYWQNAKYF
jgi:DNA-binding CsgD family transcriptional regulator